METPEIFISYTHADNTPLAKGLEGWIDLLHQRLADQLFQELGYKVKIWRDSKLVGNDIFSEEIFNQLSRTAIIVSVLSPRYLTSEWCQRELNEFCKYAEQNGGLRLNSKSRVFKIVKTYIKREDHPSSIQDSLGYEFFEMDQMRERPDDYNAHIELGGDLRYWKKLKDLVWDIKEFIKSLEAQFPPVSVPASHTPHTPIALPSNAAIYLAETTADLREQRDEIRRELQQHGHLILPDGDLPLRTSALMEAVRGHISHSRLAVHLIGQQPGIAQLQYELAAERAAEPNFTQLIWLPDKLQSDDPRHQAFIEELQRGNDRPKNAELLQISLEDLKTRIHDKLAIKKKIDATTNGNGSNASVYLICDKPDYEAVAPLRKHLIAQGLIVELPLLEGTDDEYNEYHKDMLATCDASMIYCGTTREYWFKSNLSKLRRSSATQRETPMLAKAIFLDLPQTDWKASALIPDALTITSFGAFNPNVLTPFLDQIRQAKGAI